MFTYCIQSTLLENITFICTSFRSRKGSDSCHLFFHLYNIWIVSLIQYYASIDDLHIFPLIFACNKTIIKLLSWCKLTVRRCLGWSVNIIFLFFNVMLLWHHWHNLTKSLINILSLICFARNGVFISFGGVLCDVHAYCYGFLLSSNMNQVPETIIFWSETVYSKHLSSQCNLTAQIKPVQDKRS
jgi:hypothetical protein